MTSIQKSVLAEKYHSETRIFGLWPYRSKVAHYGSLTSCKILKKVMNGFREKL